MVVVKPYSCMGRFGVIFYLDCFETIRKAKKYKRGLISTLRSGRPGQLTRDGSPELARPPLLEPEQSGHHVADEVGFRSAGRRGARDEIEHLAVFHAIIGDFRDLAVLVEINRQNVLVG